VALILVLLVLALLLTIVAEFAQAMRLEAVTATNFRSALSETWLAQAAYQRATAEILPDVLSIELDLKGLLMFRRARLGTPKVPERIDVSAGPGRLSYRLTDESTRINLNRASRDVLDRLLQEADVEKSDRDVIDEHRLNGAESDYYLALPVPYQSKNADFDSVDELLQVRGVTRALLYGRGEFPGLAEYLTIVGTGGINVNTASPLVLRVLGFAPAEVDLLVSRRPYLDLTTLPPGLRRGNLRASSDIFRIEAWAGGATPNGRVLMAVVQRQAGPGQLGQGGAGRAGTGEVSVGQVQVTPVAWRWSEASRETTTPATLAPERAKGKS
jgi:type II secretory pathway component PulK